MHRRSLVRRLILAQAIVIGIGAAALILTGALVAPTLFHRHLVHAGVSDPLVQVHAEEAFATAYAISIAMAVTTSLMTAAVMSWILLRRVTRPVQELARAAQSVAAGRFEVQLTDGSFSLELEQLSASFAEMARQLGQTEQTRNRMLGDLAHELRTPLATLEAYIDGLEDEVLPLDAQAWATMRVQVARLRRLVLDLREVAAAQENALTVMREPLEGYAVVQAAVSAAAPQFSAKGVALLEDLGPGAPSILGDGVRLQQVLGNLLDNALRHTPEAGQVEVVARAVLGEFVVQVRDSGEGIPPEELGSIFERFHRVDAARTSLSGGGSGLGLTIARAIVAHHGGTLKARSAGLGRGATLVLALPLATLRATPAPADPAPG